MSGQNTVKTENRRVFNLWRKRQRRSRNDVVRETTANDRSPAV